MPALPAPTRLRCGRIGCSARMATLWQIDEKYDRNDRERDLFHFSFLHFVVRCCTPRSPHISGDDPLSRSRYGRGAIASH